LYSKAVNEIGQQMEVTAKVAVSQVADPPRLGWAFATRRGEVCMLLFIVTLQLHTAFLVPPGRECWSLPESIVANFFVGLLH